MTDILGDANELMNSIYTEWFTEFNINYQIIDTGIHIYTSALSSRGHYLWYLHYL